MRILLLNTFPVWGGDENWTVNLGKGLMDKGHHVVISCPPGSETQQRAEERGLITFPFHIGPDIAFWKIPPFQKYLKNHKIEVLLAVQNRDVKIGALAARLAGIPAIFGRQGLNTIKKKFDHKIAFTRYLDGLITNTKSIKEFYEPYNWFSKDFIHVVYDGLTLPKDIPEIDLHHEFSLNPDSKVIIGTGRLAEQKRFDLLIKMAKLAKDEGLNWSILVAGTGNLSQKLNELVIEYSVEDIIKFVGFRSDVLTLMKSSDLFVLSSDSEGMSNALREAMAVGKACVATDVFGVSELFQEGESGIMVEKGNEVNIFNAIKEVFSNPELKLRIEKNGATLIKSSFTMQKMVDHVEKIFENQLAKNKLNS